VGPDEEMILRHPAMAAFLLGSEPCDKNSVGAEVSLLLRFCKLHAGVTGLQSRAGGAARERVAARETVDGAGTGL